MKDGDTVPGIIADLVSQGKLSRRQIQASLLDLMGASVDTVCETCESGGLRRLNCRLSVYRSLAETSALCFIRRFVLWIFMIFCGKVQYYCLLLLRRMYTLTMVRKLDTIFVHD